MNHFFSNKKLIGLLVGVIGIVTLYTVSSRYAPTVVTKGINDVLALPARALSTPGNLLRDFVDSVNALTNTYEENQSLKRKIETTYELEAQVADLKKDNEKMKDQLDVVDGLNDYSLINASVIGRNPDSWLEQVIINKGSQNGVEMDMSVMSGNGLIGRVTEVNLTTSKITLLTSSDTANTRIAAMIQSDDKVVYGTISNDPSHNQQLIMTQIDQDADIKEGDQVVTSGLGGISPRSLLIGSIESVKMDQYGLFKEVTIKQSADTNDIRYVTLVKRSSESEESE
ncbi:MAG: rod shape-determining protein MreC [Bavariicoccus seileri]|uniref:Cell shape-determining protein MreC n=1 Tax=Bavariicoccus seileri TaxID=549685 RepID=A0A3D4S6N1_9ENTE|nr:rod shape-determining protein MreC [Bavariicoccus seileri]HCS93611.1 rod shape-determining protein MreC [Bavariicoccus seileri]